MRVSTIFQRLSSVGGADLAATLTIVREPPVMLDRIVPITRHNLAAAAVPGRSALWPMDRRGVAPNGGGRRGGTAPPPGVAWGSPPGRPSPSVPTPAGFRWSPPAP